MSAAIKFPPMAQDIARQYPDAIAAKFEREFTKLYESAKGRQVDKWQTGQAWLKDVHAGYERNKIKGVPLYAQDSQLVERAEDCAAGAYRLANQYAGAGLAIKFERLAEYCKRCGVKPPELSDTDQAVLWIGTEEARAERIAPKVERMQCAKWWRRRIRDKHTRTNERLARQLGMVRKQERAYVSEVGLRIVKQRNAANAETLANMEAVNTETGESMLVSEVAKTGTANPDVRYDEMITRILGIQEIAKREKLVGRFVTLTAPSRFHSHYKKSGQRIENHNGETPRKAQQWLSAAWARTRSELARMGLDVAGMRVAEPHHDGCPHWHMIVFFKSEVSAQHFEWVIRGQAYEKGDGVEECIARLDFKTIDLVKYPNGVVGYLVKYLTKNLSKKDAEKAGGQLGFDYETDGGFSDGIDRIRAWSSVWGLRQFQFIGGASVTVWRELRRVKEPLENEQVERLRLACGIEEPMIEASDRRYPPDWAVYLNLQGGLFISNRQQKVTTLKEESKSVYGDKAEKVVGVRLDGYTVTTRQKWVVRLAPREVQQVMSCEEQKGNVIRLTREMIEARAKARAVEQAEPKKAAKAATWSCVNNCTEESEAMSKQIQSGQPLNRQLDMQSKSPPEKSPFWDKNGDCRNCGAPRGRIAPDSRCGYCSSGAVDRA